MFRALFGVFAMVSLGCASAPPSPPVRASAASESSAPAPSVCAEPTKLARVAAASEPEDPITWRRGGDDHLTIKDGARTYTMSLEGAITATENGKTLWKASEVQVAGGAFDIMLSPKGTFVVRLYSRGGLELFDAKDGKLLRKVGDAVPAPDDRFVLEVPRIPFGLDKWDHDDVRVVPLDPAQPVKSVVKLPLVQPDIPQFGAAVCGTGALLAVSFSTTELAIFRASDLQKLASAPNPGVGVPVFTRSGRYVVVREHDKPGAVFELIR